MISGDWMMPDAGEALVSELILYQNSLPMLAANNSPQLALDLVIDYVVHARSADSLNVKLGVYLVDLVADLVQATPMEWRDQALAPVIQVLSEITRFATGDDDRGDMIDRAAEALLSGSSRGRIIIIPETCR